MTLDQIEAYYIDVLGYSQEDCSEMTTDELWDNLTKEQQLECDAYNDAAAVCDECGQVHELDDITA